MNAIVRCAAVLMCTLAAPAMAQQDYPTRPIRIIVPFLPVGATNLLARLLSVRFHAAWGQVAPVENRPGAGGNIGADAVAKSAADGYTLLMNSASATVNVTLYPKMPYDWFALWAPAGTPPAIISQVHAEAVKSLQHADMKTFMQREGAEPVGNTPGEFAAHINREIEKYARIIKSSGAKADA